MAQYTVIQDIEAEDKFVGPLTLRQFIFAGITVILLYLCFIVITRNLWPAVIVLLPPALVSGFLAFPWGRDQPTEIWLLGRLRFIFKPRVRIWNQAGLQELVTITVPKKAIVDLTDGLDETQVQSRLEALAHTLDTRGWALKGIDVNMATSPAYGGTQSSDRLIGAAALPSAQPIPTVVRSGDDILDMQNNPVAQQMDTLVRAKDVAHREALFAKMNEVRAAQTGPQPAPTPTGATPQPAYPAAPQPTAVPQTYPQQPVASQQPPAQPVTPMPEPLKPAILELANNDDLSVATISRQANKVQSGDDEVVISLR